MNHSECATVRELLPDFAASRLDGRSEEQVMTHLPDCEDCRAELELAERIYSAREIPPLDLAGRIVGVVRQDRRVVRRPWWGVSAAAVAALMIGIGVSSNGDDGVLLEAPEYATELEEGEFWMSDDGLLAGAPSLDGLSDEALMELLDELTLGSVGGAV